MTVLRRAFVPLLILTAVHAEAETVRASGRVLSMSGHMLILGVPVTTFGQFGSYRVDLSKIPQSSLTGVRSGDDITVVGDFDGREITATEIYREAKPSDR
jgi:hypothetical protein